ncbi:hypothetical protein GIB67_023996 [Kingdonia uniflora]|uniref:Pentatricopeptide repeat-containing protein n=2 Tax=Kingdonia uniflora TaxID=39325 RepID=A0A7J7LEB6_9MAGN|nr:hypothetical protein GIB67_023996 [Kingdonia uniflora]
MRLFEELENRGLKPNIVTYNTVINHICKSNNVDEAKELFDSLPSKESQPDTQTFTLMINGLITKGMLKKSEDLFTKMVENGLTPDDITYNTMVILWTSHILDSFVFNLIRLTLRLTHEGVIDSKDIVLDVGALLHLIESPLVIKVRVDRSSGRKSGRSLDIVPDAD